MPDYSESLVARLKAEGAAAFSRTMRQAATSVRSVGSSAKAMGSDVASSERQLSAGEAAARRFASSLRFASGETRSLTSSVRGLATGYAALRLAGAAKDVIGLGTAYNQMQDSQLVAFQTFLHSESAARTLMGQIQQLALDSPILDPQSTGDAARLLLNYGVTAQQVLPFVKAIGDASAASGRSIAETMPGAARAIGQIASKGRLQMEEINQLAESIGINQKELRRQLGMTAEEFSKAFTPGHSIRADVALPAIRRTLVAQSAGAGQMLARTTQGQIARMREQFARQLGRLTRPVYDEAGTLAGVIADRLGTVDTTRLQAAMGNAMIYLENLWGRSDLSIGQKLSGSPREIAKAFGPWAHEAKIAIDNMHLGQKLSDAVDYAAPKVLAAFGRMAQYAASHFVTAWLQAGVWTKLITAAWLLNKIGVFRGAGAAAGGYFVDSFMGRVNGGKGGKGGFAEKMGPLGRAAGMAFGLAMAIPIGLAIRQELLKHPAAAQYSGKKGWKELGKDLADDAKQVPGKVWSAAGRAFHLGGRASGGSVWQGGPYMVGERGPEIVNLNRRDHVTPAARVPQAMPKLQAPIFQPLVVVEVNGRQFLKAIGPDLRTEMARSR
jgi:tape measure domain-containing protein